VTEADWISSQDPHAMLAFLRDSGRASDHKLRLFACAACRSVWDSLTPLRVRRAVETAERYAEGQATEEDLRRAQSLAGGSVHAAQQQESRRRGGPPLFLAKPRMFFAAQAAQSHTPFLIGRLGLVWHDDHLKAVSPPLLRDIFGPLPFRPVAIAPSLLEWRDRTVMRLAQAAYDGRQLPAGTLERDRLAVLADALEEAGCTDKDILGHLREQGAVHVRGCWCIDLLLARS
jgi:hypothetical protein